MDPWIYIVILGASVIGYANLKTRPEAADSTQVVSDIETTLSQFAEELEEDNKALVERIGGLKRDLEAEIHRLSGRIEALERFTPRLLEGAATGSAVEAASSEKPKPRKAERKAVKETPVASEDTVTVTATENDEPEENSSPQIEALNIKNRYTELFELNKQGKSIEYIAKKTGMNKGEVQLIMQLAKQEEQFRD